MQKIFIEFSYIINGKETRTSCEPNFPFDDCEKLIELFRNDILSIKESQKAQIEDQKIEQSQQQEA